MPKFKAVVGILSVAALAAWVTPPTYGCIMILISPYGL